jgi:hypothetical protein
LHTILYEQQMYDIISEKKAMTGQTVYGERKRLIVF